MTKLKKPEYFLMFFFSLALIIFLSFTQRHNNWYLVSSIPFWSLAIGYGTYKVVNLFHSKMLILGILIFATYISYKTFTINITSIIHTTSAVGEKESGLYLKAHTKENEVIARLDHLYPSMIYYSERKVLVSPSQSTQTRTYFVSRSDLTSLIKKRKIRWLAGTNESINQFISENKSLKFKVIKINQDERIIEVLS